MASLSNNATARITTVCPLAPIPREQVEVLLPPARLRTPVVCAIVRRVAAVDPPRPLHADVQANPYACLNLIIEGTVEAAAWGVLPNAFLCGPFTAPVATLVPGPLRSVSIVMQPWLLRGLLKLDPGQMVDRILDLGALAVEGMPGLSAAAAELAGDLTGGAGPLWSALDALLGPCDLAAEPRLALQLLGSDGVRPAAQACGLGERQYRRHFIQHMGLRPSTWVRLSRLETVMHRMSAPDGRPPNLSELALEAGYADQAHMSREAQSLVRHPPGRLQRQLKGGDAAWSLLPAGPISSRRGGSGK